MSTSNALRFLKHLLVNGAIVVVTLVVIDAICMTSGLFPPVMNYGDPNLGWLSGQPTGRMAIGKCTEFSTGETKIFQRNEDGVRTSLSRAAVLADTLRLRIGVSGDSQTDLCATNDQLPGGVLETELNAHRHPSTVITYG